MSSQVQIVQLLRDELARLRMRNNRYSLRAFAKRLKLWPSTLSDILKGRRQITRKMGVRILKQLQVDPATSTKLLNELQGKYSKRTLDFHELSEEQFQVIAEWQHYGILSLAETVGFRDDPRWISRRLGLPVKRIKASLDRLERLGMFKRDEEGRLVLTGTQLTTPQDIVSAAIRAAHQNNLDQARSALLRQDVPQRDFSAITMAIDTAKLPEAKKRVEKFRRDLCAFLESGEKKEVFKLCVQLFSLSTPVAPPTERSRSTS